jgi:hypothetical protein
MPYVYKRKTSRGLATPWSSWESSQGSERREWVLSSSIKLWKNREWHWRGTLTKKKTKLSFVEGLFWKTIGGLLGVSCSMFSNAYTIHYQQYEHLIPKSWALIQSLSPRERVYTAPESNGGELCTTPANAWYCAWWSCVCGCSSVEIHFMKFPKNSSCADFASRGSLELCIKHLQLNGADLAGQKFDELTCWKGGFLLWCHVESHWALQ